MKNLRKLSVLAVLVVGFGIVGLDRANRDARPAWPSPGTGPNLTVDGGAPPPPPIPLPPPKDVLTADGGGPPAPPIPLAST